MTVALSWNAVSGALSYNVYRGVITGGPYDEIATNLTARTYTDGPGNLVNGQTYYYVVTATTADGESVYSSEVTATAPAVPSAPTGVAAVVT